MNYCIPSLVFDYFTLQPNAGAAGEYAGLMVIRAYHLGVTLVAVDSEISINAAMLQEGLARIEKRNRWDRKERQQALDNLQMFQEEAWTSRRGMWQYGDIQSDDEDTAPPPRKASGRK